MFIIIMVFVRPSFAVRDGQDSWMQGERRLSHDVPWVGFLVLQRIFIL